MKQHLRKLPLVIVVLAVAALLAYGFWPAAVEVDVAETTRETLLVTVNEDGKTRIRERYVVSTPVGGRLLRLELHAGDPIEQGRTVLARIEPQDPSLLDPRERAEAESRLSAAEAAELQAQAALEHAEEAFELAKHEFERASELVEKKTISLTQFDHAEHQQYIAQADVRSASFALKVARFEVELARAALIGAGGTLDGDHSSSTFTILSPVDGQVLRVFQESAGVVLTGTQLLELGDPRDLEMVIDVLSTDAVKIRPGVAVIVEHWGGTTSLEGVVRIVEPAAFLKISALGVEEQRVNVIADFISPLEQRRTLGDEYRIEARIVVDEAPDVVTAAAGTLFRDGDDWFAYRVVRGRAKLQPLEIGRTSGLRTEIRAGVSPGEPLILHPTDKIHDGVRVRRR